MNLRIPAIARAGLLALIVAGVSARGAAGGSGAVLFPVEDFRLTNGLRVLALEDHHCPIVAVQVWYQVGSVDEPEGRRGFAHLFEHMMFRGTDRLGPTDHMDLIRRVGGNCNAYTSFDETCYEETLPGTQLELAMWLESERMAFLTVDSAGFAIERKVVEEERRMNLNQPYGDLPDLGLPLVFGAHPYGHSPLGTITDLRQATAADVHAWWRQWYAPNNAVLVVAGDIRKEEVRSMVQRYFGWIPAVEQIRRPVPRVGLFERSRQVELKLENAPAPGVGIGWRTVPTGHPDAMTLEVAANILGVGESSRLYRRLVVQERVAVMALAMSEGLRQAGGFGVGAALLPIGGDSRKAMALLKEEVERLRAGPPTEEELEKARIQAIRQLYFEAQTVFGKARLIGRAAVTGAGVEELNTRLDRLRRLNGEEVRRVANLYLDPQRALVATVPGSGLLDQLGRLFKSKAATEEDAPVSPSPVALYRGRPGVVRPAGLPDHPPVLEVNPEVPKPNLSEYHLTNGLRVLYASAPGTALELTLALPFGAWAEEKPGAAAMALSLLGKGTETHDEQFLAAELERHGIRLSGIADRDDSRIEVSCLPDQAERAFALLAEVATQPVFGEAPFKIAISQATTGLAISDNDPAAVSDREFDRQLFGKHPYARPPLDKASDLAALRREDLAAFWKAIAHPGQATLIIAGSITPERARELSERYLGQWKNDGTNGLKAPLLSPGSTNCRIVLVDWPGARQSEIRMGGNGLRVSDPDKPIADLVGSYFGGSFGSRLMKAIRVEQGNTYGVRGLFQANRFGGSFEVATFSKTASTGETVRNLLKEIQNLTDRPPTNDELSLHRRFFLGSAAARFETPGQISRQLARISLNGLPLDYVQRTFSAIGKADAAQCTALVRRFVDPRQMLIVIVGDASRIAPDLRGMAPLSILDRTGKPVPEATDAQRAQ